MYEVCLSSSDCGVLTLVCYSRSDVQTLINLAFNHSLDVSIREAKDAEPDT